MVDPNDIQLSPKQQRLIAERATENGKPWQTVLQEALVPQAIEEDDWLDTEYMKQCKEQRRGQKPVGLEGVREALSTIPGELSEEIVAEQDGRS